MGLARELVTEKGIGESADAVWKQLQKQQEEVFGVRAMKAPPSDNGDEPMTDSVPEVFVPPGELLPEVVSQLLTFGTSLDNLRRRKSSRRLTDDATSDQLALF